MKFFLLFMCLFTATLVQSQDEEIIDQVIGQVGSEIILLSDVENSIKQFKAQQQGNLPPNAECFVLENLLAQKLLVNQANLDSIIVSDVEVEAQVELRIDRILGMMGNDRDYFISYYNKTPEEMREEMFDGVKDMMLEERMRESVISNINITPTEVKQFFNSIPTDSLPYYDSEVEVSEIVINPVPNDSSKAWAKKRLEEIVARIEAGESFEELAGQYSDDPGSARQGGNLGWAKSGQYEPEFEAAAFKLEPNEISPVIESPFGYHVIQLLERRGDRRRLRHILKKPNIEPKDHDMVIQNLDSIRKQIAIDTLSFEQAVVRFSDENTQSFNNGGRIINPKSGDTYFPVGDLDPDIYFAIDTLEVGDITRPLEFLTPRGETSYRIVKLVSKSAPHQASLSKDYAKIQEIAKNSKTNEFLFNWLEKKVNETYITLDQSIYPACENVKRWVKEDSKETKP